MHQTGPQSETEEAYKRRCKMVNKDTERQLRDQKERDVMMQSKMKDLKELSSNPQLTRELQTWWAWHTPQA